MWERAKDSETYFSENCKAIPPIKSSQEEREKNMKTILFSRVVSLLFSFLSNLRVTAAQLG